jgi:hypothetical protein
MLLLLDIKALSELEADLLIKVTTKVVEILFKCQDLTLNERKNILNKTDDNLW